MMYQTIRGQISEHFNMICAAALLALGFFL